KNYTAVTIVALTHFLSRIYQVADTQSLVFTKKFVLFCYRFRDHKQITKLLVHSLSDITRKFQVLSLVVTHGYVFSTVEQNVCCHKHWVVKKPYPNSIHSLLLLLACHR